MSNIFSGVRSRIPFAKFYLRCCSTEAYVAREHKVTAHNYHPIPVVLTKGEGVYVWDVNGKRYFDFLSAYSAVNQGHSHPRILRAAREQMGRLALTSRAFHNDKLASYCEFMTNLLGYDKLLPMNTGAEAVETGVKLAKKWGYREKGIEENCAKIVVCVDNFHGRTAFAYSATTDPTAYGDFGPYLPGILKIPFGDREALESALTDSSVAAFLVEPIQGEAGVKVPYDGYMRDVRAICDQANVLLIADEIQTGLGRTGKMLCVDYDGIKPDIILLGKALSGGVYPISAAMADDSVMLQIQPGQHGSTFGGNPLACQIALEAMKVIIDEKLPENASQMGKLLERGLQSLPKHIVKLVRGRGLMHAVVIDEKFDAFDVCMRLRDNGLLAKPTHGDTIRLAPPLVINKAQIEESLDILQKTLESY